MALTSLSSCTLSCPSLPSADSNTRTLSSTNVMSIPHTAATSVAASVKNTRCIGVRIVPLIGRKHHPEHLGRESPTQRHIPLRCQQAIALWGQRTEITLQTAETGGPMPSGLASRRVRRPASSGATPPLHIFLRCGPGRDTDSHCGVSLPFGRPAPAGPFRLEAFNGPQRPLR